MEVTSAISLSDASSASQVVLAGLTAAYVVLTNRLARNQFACHVSIEIPEADSRRSVVVHNSGPGAAVNVDVVVVANRYADLPLTWRGNVGDIRPNGAHECISARRFLMSLNLAAIESLEVRISYRRVDSSREIRGARSLTSTDLVELWEP